MYGESWNVPAGPGKISLYQAWFIRTTPCDRSAPRFMRLRKHGSTHNPGPQGEAIAFWEEYGLTREMFEHPGAMTKQEVELFHRALNQAIIDNRHYFAQAARYRQECAAGTPTFLSRN
jgi:hypothetical protein